MKPYFQVKGKLLLLSSITLLLLLVCTVCLSKREREEGRYRDFTIYDLIHSRIKKNTHTHFLLWIFSEENKMCTVKELSSQMLGNQPELNKT